MIAIKAVVIAACAVQAVYALPTNDTLPVVDLDYALHRATINVCNLKSITFWSAC